MRHRGHRAALKGSQKQGPFLPPKPFLMAKSNAKSSSKKLLETVKGLIEAEKYQQVIDLLPDSKLEAAKNADLYAEKAKAYYRLDQFDLSSRAAENALAINPEQVKAIHYRGNAYLDKKQYDKAIEAYSKAIQLDPKFAYPYNGLGNVYVEQREYAKAAQVYIKAGELDPKDAIFLRNLGSVYEKQSEYDKAIEAYSKAIELDPGFADSYNDLGNIYRSQQQYDKAIAVYNKAIELDPRNAIYPYNLGNVFYDQGKYDKAIESYSKAIGLDPKDADSYTSLGLIYHAQNHNQKAIDAYTKAIKLGSKYSGPYYNRALLYFNAKKYKNALADFTKYVQLTSHDPDYYTSIAKDRISEINKLFRDQDYKIIRELVDKIKKLLLFTDECVTHYTSLSAAKILILERKPFLLSEGTYLNDTSEGREVFNYLSFHTTFHRTRDTAAEQFSKKPFIGSFVAENKHDDLTLWRMYGKEAKEEAKGCAITLLRDNFLKNLIQLKTSDSNTTTSSKTNEEFNFYRVAYKTDQKEGGFTIPGASKEDEDTLNTFMKDLAEKIASINKEDRESEVQDIMAALNEIAYLFKSAEYQYENEVRLVIKEVGFDKLISLGSNPPKVQIALTSITPVLKQITLGPKVDRSDEWASAFYYSLDMESFHPEILISHLPFK
jgi:tetratricopeptide (TPR) repeat protein